MNKKDFEKIEKYCLQCGKRLTIKTAREITGKKFCSKSCHSKHNRNTIPTCGKINFTKEIKEKMRKAKEGKYLGKTNPNFRHGEYIGSSIYKKIAFNHYPHYCQKCGTIKNLCVHHLDLNRNNYNLDNLIILCKSCHQKLHSILKRSNNGK